MSFEIPALSRQSRAFAILLAANFVATALALAGAFIPSELNPNPGLDVLHRHWDGPPYVVVAKSLYDPLDEVWEHYGRAFGQNWGAEDHAAHLALYPMAIRAVAPLAGYFNALLITSFLFTTVTLWMLYKLLADFDMVSQPLWACLAFIVFPPRWLLYHSVGSSEPPFLFFVIAALYCYRSRWLAAAGALGALAAITRIYGVLLFPAFLAVEALRVLEARGWQLRAALDRDALVELGRAVLCFAPIPLLLTAHFVFYHYQLGSFWAYFDQNGAELSAIPFKRMFGPLGYGNVLMHFFLFYGLAWHWYQGNRDIALVCGAFMLPNFFVLLYDFGRFLIPVYPFLLFPPFDFVWRRRESKIALVACLPMIYAYTWGSLPPNGLHPRIYESLHSYLSSVGG